METLRQFQKALKKKIVGAIHEGDIDKANEITANLMVGSFALYMAVLMLVACAMNEADVFSASKPMVRIATGICVLISCQISFLNRHYKGDKPYLRYVLIYGLVLECGALVAILGHNVTLVTIIPLILSIRYFDSKFTLQTAIVCAVVFFIATVLCAFLGIVNLNVLPVSEGTGIQVSTSLRDAAEGLVIDRIEYAKSYIKNDYLPKAITFVVIAAGCCTISKRGRQVIDAQAESSKKTSRIETELNLATEIQMNMLPCTLPAFPEHENLELFARNIPAKEVGGDFYDYFRVDDDHVAVVIADVSGKGVGAALFMMIAKTVIKNQLQAGLSPRRALNNANAQLSENNTADIFVTAWAGVYEVSTGKLTYVNAGHNPPILKRNGKDCSYHRGKTGFVLAGLPNTKYEQSVLTLHEGDELFLYTDGITEATNSDLELYGEDRLLECVEKFSGGTVEEQVLDVFASINEFAGEAEQFDDITMLILKVNKKPEKTSEE